MCSCMDKIMGIFYGRRRIKETRVTLALAKEKVKWSVMAMTTAIVRHRSGTDMHYPYESMEQSGFSTYVK
jgi:hypothetical protein